VGDVAQVPTLVGNYHGADSDGLYGLLSGDDLFVDILVSRLPARNASEARVMIDRVIRYERDVQAGAAWCGRAAGIASDEGTPPDYERAELLRDRLLAAGLDQVDRVYQGLGGDRPAIAASLAGGVGLVNYLGHGSSTSWLSVPFDNADVHALTNTAAWPWIIDVSCSNGDFSLDECFAEAWLRANHGGQPAGAVAMISASTAASWIPPTVMQSTMIDALTGEGQSELGAIYTAGVAEVLVQYAGLGQDQKLMEQYNLFGDASMRVRMLPPDEMSVAHDSWLPSGTAAWSVTASAGARVVLTAGQERLARADADAGGEVLLVPSRPLIEGEQVTLTVTADQAVTYRTVVSVAMAQTAVEAPRPGATALLGNYPNPFNPATTIAFETASAGPVRLSILDARGRLVATVVQDLLPAGSHEARWDGRDRDGRPASAGVYLARLDHGGRSMARSLTLVK
jgi:gingipain R